MVTDLPVCTGTIGNKRLASSPRTMPSLTPDGRLEGRLSRVEPPAPVPASPAAGATLELAERRPAPPPDEAGPYRDAPRDGRRRFVVLTFAAFALGLGLLGAVVLAPRFGTPGKGPEGVRALSGVESLLSAGRQRLLVVESTPPGAAITIEGQPVGVTPWAGSNAWAPGAKVELRLPGHEAWAGALSGAAEQRVDAALKRR